MIRSEARTYLAMLINKASTSTRWQGVGATDELNIALEHANRWVWARGMRRDPSRFVVDAGITRTAGVAGDDLTLAAPAGLGADFLRIKRIYETSASGNVSGTITLKRVIRRVTDQALFDAYMGGQQGLEGGQFCYMLDGKLMIMAPVPTETMFLRVGYLPKPPNLSANVGAVPVDSNHLLSPIADPAVVWFVEHHEVVVLEAARRCYAKVGGMPPELSSLADTALAEFDEDFADDRATEPEYIEDPHSSDTDNYAG